MPGQQLGKTVQEITKWKPFFSQGKECWQFKCSNNRRWRNGRVWVIIPGKKKKLFLLLANLLECNDKNFWNLIGHLLFQNKNLKF